jgi:hypothetical protein
MPDEATGVGPLVDDRDKSRMGTVANEAGIGGAGGGGGGGEKLDAAELLNVGGAGGEGTCFEFLSVPLTAVDE